MNSRSVGLFLGAVGLMAGATGCGSKPETMEGGEAGGASQERVQPQNSGAISPAPAPQPTTSEGGEGGEGGES